MSKVKHGLIGSTVKVLMVIVFAIIGALILTFGILGLTMWKKDFESTKWIPICNTVFGACLLTSPFFLSNKRGGLNRIIQIAMVIVFVAIGIIFITSGVLGLTKYKADYAEYKWYPIVNLVFGCLLFTSPFFLKKSMLGSRE